MPYIHGIIAKMYICLDIVWRARKHRHIVIVIRMCDLNV